MMPLAVRLKAQANAVAFKARTINPWPIQTSARCGKLPMTTTSAPQLATKKDHRLAVEVLSRTRSASLAVAT